MILPRRLRIAPLLLALLLIAGPLAAAVHRPQEWQPRLNVIHLLSETWALVSQIWEYAGGSTSAFEKAGSGIDPFGNPKPSSQPGDSAPATTPSSSGN